MLLALLTYARPRTLLLCDATLSQSVTRDNSHVIVSVLQETYVFRFEDDKGTTVSSVGGSDKCFLSSQTSAVSNIQWRIPGLLSAYVDSSLVVQIVPEGLLLLNYDPLLREYTRVGDLWTLDKISNGNSSWAGRAVVAADMNASQVVIALSSGRLVQFNLDGDCSVKHQVRECVESLPLNCAAEISAVTCLPLDSTKSLFAPV